MLSMTTTMIMSSLVVKPPPPQLLPVQSVVVVVCPGMDVVVVTSTPAHCPLVHDPVHVFIVLAVTDELQVPELQVYAL